MGVSSCPMIGSYRPLRQTGKNSVCIRRIVCIRLSYQSGGCKSVESSFTGRALETSSKIEDCKGSPSLERGDGPATAARKEVLLLLQAKAGRQTEGRTTAPSLLPLLLLLLFVAAAKGRERSWVVGWSSARAAAWRRAMEEGEGLRRSDGEEEQEEIKEVLAEAASPASAPHLLLFLPSPPPPLLLLLLLLPPRKAGGHQLAS